MNNKNSIKEQFAGNSFLKSVRKNVKPINQLVKLKDNTHSLLNNTKEIMSVYEPILKPMSKIPNVPC